VTEAVRRSSPALATALRRLSAPARIKEWNTLRDGRQNCRATLGDFYSVLSSRATSNGPKIQIAASVCRTWPELDRPSTKPRAVVRRQPMGGRTRGEPQDTSLMKKTRLRSAESARSRTLLDHGANDPHTNGEPPEPSAPFSWQQERSACL